MIFSICSKKKRTLPPSMPCLGCPASRGETIEEACEVHGVNCDELLEKLNTHLAAKKA